MKTSAHKAQGVEGGEYKKTQNKVSSKTTAASVVKIDLTTCVDGRKSGDNAKTKKCKNQNGKGM